MTVGEIFFSIPLALTTAVFAVSLFKLKEPEVDEETERQSRWHY